MRPALPSRRAAHGVATCARCAVAKDFAPQADTTRAALSHGSRAVPSQAEVKHGDPAAHRCGPPRRARRTSPQRSAIVSLLASPRLKVADAWLHRAG